MDSIVKKVLQKKEAKGGASEREGGSKIIVWLTARKVDNDGGA